MHNQWRVVPRDDRPHQDTLYEVARRHQDVESVAAVLHTCLQDLPPKPDKKTEFTGYKTRFLQN